MTVAGTSMEGARPLLARFDFAWSLVAAYGLGLALTFTGTWQLVAIAGGVAGAFIAKRASVAWWCGFGGVALAWLTITGYFITTQPAAQLVDLILQYITGSAGLWWVGWILTLLIGALAGGAGALVGFAIRRLAARQPA